MTYENLKTNLGKILRKSYEVSKIGPQVSIDHLVTPTDKPHGYRILHSADDNVITWEVWE